MSLPINHLIQTLNRCSGRWEFLDVSSRSFLVRFLNTGRRYICCVRGRCSNGVTIWEAYEQTGDEDSETLDDRLTGILNGHKRDDSGVLHVS